MAEFKDPLPLEMVFVRHGQSEANVLQAAEKGGYNPTDPNRQLTPEIIAKLRERPDWEHRLTDKGIQQAITTGVWLTENYGPIGEYFDARFYSPFVRTRETAAYLGGTAVGWRNHPMLYERDWGEFGVTPKDQQQELFKFASHTKEQAPLFARLGESIAETVALRVINYRNDLRMRWSDKRVLTVAHGDIIGGGIRYVFEHMLPEEWHKVDRDRRQSIGNCAVLSYSRYEDPEKRSDSDAVPYVKWFRIVDPNNLKRSPFGGEWQQIPYKSERNGEEILASIASHPRILPATNQTSRNFVPELAAPAS